MMSQLRAAVVVIRIQSAVDRLANLAEEKA